MILFESVCISEINIVFFEIIPNHHDLCFSSRSGASVEAIGSWIMRSTRERVVRLCCRELEATGRCTRPRVSCLPSVLTVSTC